MCAAYRATTTERDCAFLPSSDIGGHFQQSRLSPRLAAQINVESDVSCSMRCVPIGNGLGPDRTQQPSQRSM